MAVLRLVGLTEAAALLGVTKRTATRYSRRPDFPLPAAKLAAGPVWIAEDVELWASATLPLPEGTAAHNVSQES